jgi:moderate conductance mechanosensitive channel
MAQPAEGTAANRVDTLLRAFPTGLTPEQADAVLGVMNEAELRSALRPRLLTGTEGTRSAAPEAAPMAAYAQQIDAVAAVRRSAARLRIRRVLTDEI